MKAHRVTGEQALIVDDGLQRLRVGYGAAFESLIHHFCQPLVHFVLRRVGEQALEENLVQVLLLVVWMQRKRLHPDTNLKAYLYPSAKNRD